MKGLLIAVGIVLVSAPLKAAASACQGEALGANVPHETDCTLFYSCDGNGNAVVKSCIAGYYFDPSWRYCRPSSEISCVPGGGATPTASPTTSTTKASTASTTTTSTTKASTASTTTSTTKASTASTTTSTTKAPTASTTTTSTTKASTASTTTSTTKAPTPAPTAGPPSGGLTGKECTNAGVSNGDLLPYPGDCGRFIQCSYTVAVVSSCPPGLHFNNSLKVCDWPRDAGCQS